MKKSHYNMYMKKHWTEIWGTIEQQQASQQKRNREVDL